MTHSKEIAMNDVQEERLWYVLVGAMLASPRYRKEIFTDTDLDAPRKSINENISLLIKQIQKGDGDGVRIEMANLFGLKVPEDKGVIDFAADYLSNRAESRMLLKEANKLSIVAKLTPDNVPAALEEFSDKLRKYHEARQVRGEEAVGTTYRVGKVEA